VACVGLGTALMVQTQQASYWQPTNYNLAQM